MTRVLVVEDDAVARDLLCEILRSDGFEVEAVDDGAPRWHAPPTVVTTWFCRTCAWSAWAPGRVARLHRTNARNTSHPHHRFRRRDRRHGSHRTRRLRLRVKAVQRRRAPADRGARSRTAALVSRGRRRPGEWWREEPSRRHRRQEPAYARRVQVGRKGRSVDCHRARGGRIRNGKELVARAIHNRSPRTTKPFVPVNCTALSESLLESELFGHARGAFTGAIAAKRGLFETANGGTLFLDEIGDMGPKMQAQILRVLQDGEMRPVGGTDAIRVDVRLVCATNRDLEAEVKAGRFREDLYFRINVVTVRMPPLRDRAGDIPILVRHFLNKVAKREGRAEASVSPEALDVLCRYGWPGNVRELENAIERAGGGRQRQRGAAVGLARRGVWRIAGVSGGNHRRPPHPGRAGEALHRPRAHRKRRATRKKPPPSSASIVGRSYRAIERSGDAPDPDDDSDDPSRVDEGGHCPPKLKQRQEGARRVRQGPAGGARVESCARP